MLRIVFLFSMILFLHAAQALEVGKYPKVYGGDEGLTVTMVALNPTEEKAYLVKVEGIEHELDGLVLSCVLYGTGDDTYCSTWFHGRTVGLVQSSKGWGGKVVRFYLPGVREGANLVYNEKKSKTVNASDLLALHEKQKSEGKLAKLQELSSKKAKRNIKESLGKWDSGKCRTQFHLSVDFNSVKDEDYLYRNMSSRCRAVAEALEDVCKDIPGEQKVRGKIARVECKFGNEDQVKKSGDKLEVSMKRDAYDFPARVQTFFQ